MDFHELEAFVALARHLHFARAAASVHTSPSGLSRLLSRLEDELGVRLFERDTRRVELTEQGEAFLSFATESLHRRDDLQLRLGSSDGKLRGYLRVYASVTACYSILPPFAAALSAEHPELRLSVETGDPAEAEEIIREGRVELAVAALPPKGFTDLDCFSVRRTPLVLVSSANGQYGNLALPRDTETAGKASNLDEHLRELLSTVPLILPRMGLARERFDRWARERNIKPHIAAETAGNEAILALARLGLGLGLVPRLVLENGPFAEGLVLYSIGTAFGEYDIGFVQRSTGTGTEAGKRLSAAVRDILKRTYPLGSWHTEE
ncbi:MAG: LysR substrate-binding domain-containing protein [Treponemataceae bacterium]